MKGNLSCPCGCGLGLNPQLTHMLELLESAVGFEVIVTSGARCDAYNKTVGGVSNSAHTKGLAVDISILKSWDMYKLMKELFILGITRIGDGFHKGFVHIDMDTSLPQYVMWKY